MAKKDNLEDLEQAALFEWAAFFPCLKWMHSIPNGTYLYGNKAQRGRQMTKLKKQGLTPGIHDVFLPMVTDEYPGLYIEMKRSDGKGSMSELQLEFKEYAEAQGYKCVTCLGTRSAIHAIQKYANI